MGAPKTQPRQQNLRSIHCACWAQNDQGYGTGGTPVFTDVFEDLARVALYPTDADGLGTCFDAA